VYIILQSKIPKITRIKNSKIPKITRIKNPRLNPKAETHQELIFIVGKPLRTVNTFSILLFKTIIHISPLSHWGRCIV